MCNATPEEWRHVEGYEGRYSVSSHGRVAKYNHRGVRVPIKVQYEREYQRIGLWRSRKRKWTRVHRLVAAAFIPNPDNLPEVNHKDGCAYRNEVCNLEWASRPDNQRNVYARRGSGHVRNQHTREQ